MPTADQLAIWLDDLFAKIVASGEPASDYLPEVVDTEYLEEIGRNEYHDAMEKVFDHYEVPEEMREPVYQDLDAEGEYTPAGLVKNLTVALENEDIKNHIDNSAHVGDYAEVHGGVDQYNETNVANATGDGAIAGRDQWGQFQTGDGVQVGDHNEGVVNQGDNSGQQAGEWAEAEDITTGDGNFSNEGTIEDSAIAFGYGDATNTANDVYDASVNDSFNTEHSGNVSDSYDTEYSGNVDADTEHTLDVDAHLDADVDHSFNTDDDYKDIDDSHNVVETEDVAYE